jgi:hypothetical protein
MILVDVTLVGPSDRQLHEEMVVDLLWAHARPDDCIQHISVKSVPGRADLVLFVSLANEARLRAFVGAALDRGADTRGWTVRA